MIKLEKGEQPSVLAENAVAWTRVVVDRLAAGEQPTNTEKSRYNHPHVKAALLAETRGKCAYCESKMRHVSYGDIEHVVPKSDDPSKWFEWHNLTIACDVCNTKKSNIQVSGDDFIDPYLFDPEDCFWFFGPIINPSPGNESAKLTERLLDLNRVELVERRSERIQDIMRMLDVVVRVRQELLKAVLWDEFCREAEADKEYAAMSRTIIAFAKEKLGY